MAKTAAVALDDIILDERCQPRAILNNEAVQEYADIYRDGAVKLPPLKVVDIDGSLVLLDGFHRLAGARQADQTFVRVEVVERCDIGRALWLAASMNQGHGVRRTNADKRQAVNLALDSDIGDEQSLRTIADHVGVHHSFVAKVKEEREVSPNDTPKTEPEPEAPPHDDDQPETDIYHTAAKRIRGCYRKVCAILGQDDDVCEALFQALEKAQEREL
jgi:hypothetical protein